MFRHLACSVITLGVSLFSLNAVAATDTYPNRPIRLIIPFAPGGATDVVGRLVATKLSAKLGQPVIPENRGGAGGVIGTAIVVKAKSDGYTLGIATVSTQVTNPSVMHLDYDPNVDLIPIVSIAAVPNVLLVNPSVPAKNIQEFVQIVKAEPNKYTFASAGTGSVNHIMCEIFLAVTKTKMIHVPYKGSAPAIIDVIAGRVDAECDQITSILPLVESGKLRALAVAAPGRLAVLPSVQTFKEAGLPEVNAMVWYGLIAPAGTPPEIAKKLNTAINDILADQSFKDTLEAAHVIPTGGTQEDFKKTINADLVRVETIVKEQGISIK